LNLFWHVGLYSQQSKINLYMQFRKLLSVNHTCVCVAYDYLVKCLFQIYPINKHYHFNSFDFTLTSCRQRFHVDQRTPPFSIWTREWGCASGGVSSLHPSAEDSPSTSPVDNERRPPKTRQSFRCTVHQTTPPTDTPACQLSQRKPCPRWPVQTEQHGDESGSSDCTNHTSTTVQSLTSRSPRCMPTYTVSLTQELVQRLRRPQTRKQRQTMTPDTWEHRWRYGTGHRTSPDSSWLHVLDGKDPRVRWTSGIAGGGARIRESRCACPAGGNWLRTWRHRPVCGFYRHRRRSSSVDRLRNHTLHPGYSLASRLHDIQRINKENTLKNIRDDDITNFSEEWREKGSYSRND